MTGVTQAQQAPSVLLGVADVRVQFGGVVALDNLSFEVAPGQICGLIGPNGAGKTTLFNVVSRVCEPVSGSVRFDGAELLDIPVHRIASIGVGRTFQNLALFPTMSLLENVMVGGHCHGRTGIARAILRPGVAAENRATRDRAGDLLQRLGLADDAFKPAAGLPFGTLKRLEIARALAARPRLLLMDEPAAGLTHSEVDELGELIRAIRDDFDLTILLVEHHMTLVMGVSDKVVAMEFGKKIADGTPTEVQSHPEVIAAYLGGSS